MTRRERERCRRLTPCEGISSRCADAAYCMREQMGEEEERDEWREEREVR